MPSLATQLTRWESGLKRFPTISSGYTLGTFQRCNIIYRTLPDEIQRVIDKEYAKGMVSHDDELIE